MVGDTTRGFKRRQVRFLAATATFLFVVSTNVSQPAGASTPDPGAATVAAAPAGKSGDAARRAQADDAARSAALAESIGARCKDAARGLDCVIGSLDGGDFYDIDLFLRCDDGGPFARTVAGATVFDTLPVTGSRARTTATLAGGQLVCVHAIARSGQVAAYYHATPVQPSSIAACRANPLCESRVPRGKTDASGGAVTACAVDASGLPAGTCPRGWIEADLVDLFSNGL